MDTSSGMLIFDGQCGFCSSAANWIVRRWPEESHAVALASQKLSDEDRRAIPLTQPELDRSVWWIDGYRREEGARAVARALINARGWWALLGVALVAPPGSWISPLIYRLVVRVRGCLPGTPLLHATEST